MLERMKESFFGFKIWSKNGSFYRRRGILGKTENISPKQVEMHMQKFKIRKLIKDTTNIGYYFSSLINEYRSLKKNGVSPFGERVIVTPIKVQEKLTPKGINLSGKWRCNTESGKFVNTIIFSAQGLHGPILDGGGNYAKFYASLHQLVLSGASATKEDEREYFKSWGKVKEVEEILNNQ